jgi:hypothetical protein
VIGQTLGTLVGIQARGERPVVITGQKFGAAVSRIFFSVLGYFQKKVELKNIQLVGFPDAIIIIFHQVGKCNLLISVQHIQQLHYLDTDAAAAKHVISKDFFVKHEFSSAKERKNNGSNKHFFKRVQKRSFFLNLRY